MNNSKEYEWQILNSKSFNGTAEWLENKKPLEEGYLKVYKTIKLTSGKENPQDVKM